MKRTTQKELAAILCLSPPFLSEILNGKRKPSVGKAPHLEAITGIGIRMWLYGRPTEIRRELERIYGKINMKRGRVPGKREVKK